MRFLLVLLVSFLTGCGDTPPRPEDTGAGSGLLGADAPADARDLTSPDITKRRSAARALTGGTPAAADAVEALARALADGDRTVREEAVKALRDLGPRAAPALAALRQAFSDEDVYVRWRAAEALGRIGPAAGEALADLDARARDTGESEIVRAASERAAERIRAR